MQKALIALLVVCLPVAIILGIIFYLPDFLDSLDADESIQRDSFSSIEDGKFVKSKDGEDNQSKVNNLSNDIFYHNVNISVITKKNTEFYEVNAVDPNELRAEIAHLAPENTNTSRKTITKLSYSVDWSLDTQQTENGCELYGAKIFNNITLTIPKWIGIEYQTPEVKSEWERFIASVARYESRHNKIMDKVSNAIAETIRSVKREKLCSDLIKKVNDIGVLGVRKAKDSVHKYQSETGGAKGFGIQMPTFDAEKNVSDVKTEDMLNK